jgi:hypothetical protein
MDYSGCSFKNLLLGSNVRNKGSHQEAVLLIQVREVMKHRPGDSSSEKSSRYILKVESIRFVNFVLLQQLERCSSS